ncbi:PREDICTED: testis-specific serine/threonine-protein kinase 1 [Myotis davidii]|uniref:non-specific serine/threonine protein kinase n=1 Tax=Myotis davidii TaxID=225400 RepID=L5LGN6_MYODS|nr:PREDICTED: testis-specific serine/threonine-protein kinase 1 [Myotis davidii]ELK25175.1 Testis-specific serine/threonine-protein kinase 1 [Myotis davidii]
MDDAAVLKRRGYILGINLGEGSYAKVKSAYSERLKFNVAVKIIDRKRAPTDFLEKFLPREIEILIMLNHRSIVKTYEIFETSEGKVYIIMELGVQGDLLDFIKSRGALREDDARKKFHQLSLAIKYCHNLDIVHRDLKCENLLLDKDFNIKLSDFGFSKRCLRDESGLLILSKTFCGSAAYAAPEVLQGIPYQPKVYDIWSLGVILYIMVCGSMPYDDSNIKKMLRIQKEHRINFPRSKHLTNECKDLIYRMLQPDVHRRLHIEEILSHSWVQPRPRGLSKEGGGLLGTEPLQVPEPSRTPEPSMTTQHSRTPEPSQTTGHSRTPEASRTPEVSRTTEPGSDKKSISHQEPQEEAQPEVMPESKPQEETEQGQVSRQLESTSLIAPTGQRSSETVEGRSPKPPQTQ